MSLITQQSETGHSLGSAKPSEMFQLKINMNDLSFRNEDIFIKSSVEKLEAHVVLISDELEGITPCQAKELNTHCQQDRHFFVFPSS